MASFPSSAERTSGATREISQLASSIQQSVVQAVAAMDEVATEVSSGVDRSEQAGDALARIQDANEAVTSRNRQPSAAASAMADASAELVAAMEVVREVGEEHTQPANEVQQAVDELSQALQLVSDVVDQNTARAEEMATRLQRTVLRFHLETHSSDEQASLPSGDLPPETTVALGAESENGELPPNGSAAAHWAGATSATGDR